MNRASRKAIDELLNKIDDYPLSKSLSIALRIAQRLNLKDFKKWLELEHNGYFRSNPALTEEVIVPQYRTVTGQHSDDYGRPLVFKDPKFGIVNETRLRFCVAELEQMGKRGESISLRDPAMSESIKEILDVDVTVYTFSTLQILGVLTAIKAELSRYLIDIESNLKEIEVDIQDPPIGDVIMLKPNFYGIGFDINALMKKWQNFVTKRWRKS